MKLFRKREYSLIELVEACQRGETSAQNQFYERHKNKLKGICLRYTRTEAEAEDIFQEAFIKIFTNISQLKSPELADRWVKSTVIRTAINYYHGTTKRELLNSPLDEIEHILPDSETLETLDHIDMKSLLEIINALPDGYRAIVNLYLIDGYTHAEIANMLSIAEGTSKSQLLRGKTLLIKRLQEKGIGQYGFISK